MTNKTATCHLPLATFSLSIEGFSRDREVEEEAEAETRGRGRGKGRDQRQRQIGSGRDRVQIRVQVRVQRVCEWIFGSLRHFDVLAAGQVLSSSLLLLLLFWAKPCSWELVLPVAYAGLVS